MKSVHTLLKLILLVLLIPGISYSQVFKADGGYVEFISRAPLLEFKGTSNHLAGLVDTEQNLVDFYVDLNTLETGIRRRDRDMRNTYLKTDLYPFAEFTGELVTPFDPALNQKQDVKVSGLFRIHGVERRIEVNGTLEAVNGGLNLEATFEILLEDYDIERPRVLFYELADEQIVNISILLQHSDPS